MFSRIKIGLCFIPAFSLIVSGCNQGQFGQANNQNPFSKNQLANNNGNFNPQAMDQAQQLNDSLAAKIQELNNKLSSFDSTNQDLYADVAQLKKQLAVSTDEKNLLKRQLIDTVDKYKQLAAAKTEVDGRLTAIQASARTQAGAEIRANNSLLGKLSQLNLSGIESVEDGDVIRIYLPTDKLFTQGTYGLTTVGRAMLDQVSMEIKRHFPRQLIGIEGHMDNVSVFGDDSLHRISGTQALAVFDYYRKNRSINEKQMFILGQGGNRPRYSNTTPEVQAKNRRIEIVIYPESLQ